MEQVQQALSRQALRLRRRPSRCGPRGPVPVTAARSTPLFCAMRRASGDAKMRSPARYLRNVCGLAGTDCAGAGDGAATGVGLGAFGAAGFASACTASLIEFIAAEMSGTGVSALSPSPIRVAMGALTFTPSVPSGTSSLPILPSSTAVEFPSWPCRSRSRRGCHRISRCRLPSTSHLASLPSSMVGESAGMRICVAMSAAIADRFSPPRSHLPHAAAPAYSRLAGIGHRHVLAGDLGRRCVEPVERLQRDGGGDLRAGWSRSASPAPPSRCGCLLDGLESRSRCRAGAGCAGRSARRRCLRRRASRPLRGSGRRRWSAPPASRPCPRRMTRAP